MRQIDKGFQAFRSAVYPDRQQEFEALRAGQQPETLMITCSDSRIDPALLTQTHPGELFVIRNAGNIVPAYGAVDGGEAATIEYAVRALKVKVIVVCGHSHCGAMAALQQPEAVAALPAVGKWIEHGRAALERASDISEPMNVIQANIQVQLDNLRTHPAVAEAEAAGEVDIRGWVYRIGEGDVLELDEASGTFRSLGDMAPDSAAAQRA